MHVQPASQSDEAFTEDQPGNVPEIANPSASGRTEASTYESPNGVPSQDDSIQSQIRETVTAVETTSSSASEQNTGVAHALHRQPVLSPVVDEYCQIMGNAVSWTGELLMQFLRIPLLPRGNRLINLRLDAHTDPSNAEKFSALVSALNRAGHHAEVVQLVDEKRFSLNSAAAAEYLRALVETKRLSKLAEGGAVELGEDHRSLPDVLRDLQSQLAGQETAQVPGQSLARPLHVMLQTERRPGTLVGNVLGSVLRMVTYGAFFSVLVLLGSAVLRRAAATSPGGNGIGIAATPSLPGGNGAANYAPKEYNKDAISEKSQKTFADVKGCAEAKAELEEIVAFLKDPTKFTRLGGKLPKGVLLTGPPGTGKTLLAKAVAGEAGVPFFFRAGSEFEEMFVGVGSRRVRALFAAAKKKAPCIVFIDEIDAVGASRKLWENHTRKTLNQLLVEMDGFEANEGIIVMAATNMQESLDAALTRPGRFDRHVAVPLPDVRGRLEILDYYLKDKPLSEDVDAASLARRTAGFSGAELANLVNEAALAAGKGGHARITSGMLDEAQDKILMGSERRSMVRTAESLRRTAYHESGHALVAIHTAGAHPIHKATIVPRGHALGMVSQTPEKDEYSRTRQQMSAHIDVCMGGRVAEEIIFGADQVTSGARSDFQQATREARHMVTECGMSDEIGPVFVENTESPDMRRRIDGEVSRILREAYNRVTTLLTEKEEQLHRLAKVLLEHETLTQADITDVIAGTFAREPVLRPVDSEAEALLGESAQPLAEQRSKN
ncbi:hypothetical protein WJX75_007015 [Coccomyxa subellipsoidea]|uniref:AAA+ ATPase domain-containing protein n=1 Tax=Coccomyxa subellipsoidea TaxID=248742 RepID=A0ABR2Z1A5_9CHLO